MFPCSSQLSLSALTASTVLPASRSAGFVMCLHRSHWLEKLSPASHWLTDFGKQAGWPLATSTVTYFTVREIYKIYLYNLSTSPASSQALYPWPVGQAGLMCVVLIVLVSPSRCCCVWHQSDSSVLFSIFSSSPSPPLSPLSNKVQVVTLTSSVLT